MNIERFETTLESMKEDVISRLTRLDKHIHHREASSSHAFADRAIERQNDDVVIALDETLGIELTQIKAALRRIELGEYGICRGCGREIEIKRLEAIPYVETCVQCKPSDIVD